MEEKEFFDDFQFQLEEPGTGKVLVSEPFLPDPSFSRSVILLIEHNEEGSMGFVLNQAIDFTVDELLEDLNEFPSPVYKGGPVGLNELYYIHHLGNTLFPNDFKIMNSVWMGKDFKSLIAYIKQGLVKPNDVRFFLGYSGWSPGQLEVEIKEKSWIVSSIPSEMIMHTEGNFWKRVMESLGAKFKVMSNFPEDPMLN